MPTTLLCLADGSDMDLAGEDELDGNKKLEHAHFGCRGIRIYIFARFLVSHDIISKCVAETRVSEKL